MQSLICDIETYSSINLAKSGVYRYVESPDFEILLFGYSIDGRPVQVIDLVSGEGLPDRIRDALLDDTVIKWAHNAQFERVCLGRYLGRQLHPAAWRCTMVWSAYLGLPLSLEGAALVIGAEKQKLTEGKDLVRYFCIPCRPTKSNSGRTRNRPRNAPEKWEQFKAYNTRDVETEMAIMAKLQGFPVPDDEWQNYILDQEINDRGILLDMDLVQQAIRCDEHFRNEFTRLIQELTTLENPNSVAQMKSWLASHGLETESLDKAAVRELLKNAPRHLGQVLELRQQLAKSSVKKYTAMVSVVCSDGRARGLIQFYGANRTGRYSGRLIQVQNLPANHISDLEQARSLVSSGNLEALNALYDSVPATLSELIRTAFIPQAGCKFLVADFSAIEARVIAWLAGETWKMNVFAGDGKIYEATAARMFNVPIESVTKGSSLRQKAKQSELACGYSGSVGALKAMGALEMGLSEDELQPLVTAWRQANPNIVKLWWALDRAAKTAVKEQTTAASHGIRFEYRSGMLFIALPSGRKLSYVKPRMGENRFGRESVTYEGIGATKKWERIETFGGKLAENIVQAISRDILCHAMRRIDTAGYHIVMHVHDEIVIEAPLQASVEEICLLMGETPPWAPGLILRADGFECGFYKKE